MNGSAVPEAAAPVFVEVDNAMGSTRGDVDDGFALGALLRHPVALLGLGSVFGNTSEAEADRNNRALAAAMRSPHSHLRGCNRPGQREAASVEFLAAQQRPFVMLALGPLTTVAAALAARASLPITELVIVGGDAASRGRWPPLWPYEFNLLHDAAAAVRVFASDLPITVVPLDVGRRLVLSRSDLAAIPGPFGAHARQHAERWFRRARWRFRRDAIRLYDLVAAARVLRPQALRCVDRCVAMHRRGWLEFCRSGRPVRVVEAFDATVLALLTQPAAGDVLVAADQPAHEPASAGTCAKLPT